MHLEILGPSYFVTALVWAMQRRKSYYSLPRDQLNDISLASRHFVHAMHLELRQCQFWHFIRVMVLPAQKSCKTTFVLHYDTTLLYSIVL